MWLLSANPGMIGRIIDYDMPPVFSLLSASLGGHTYAHIGLDERQ